MSGARGFLTSFIREDSGQAITEYILLLSVTVIGVGALMRGILAALDRGILTLGSAMERDLKTGRADVSIWKN